MNKNLEKGKKRVGHKCRKRRTGNGSITVLKAFQAKKSTQRICTCKVEIFNKHSQKKMIGGNKDKEESRKWRRKKPKKRR